MMNYNKGHVLDHVEKFFEGKKNEHNKPSFLVTDTYAFILAINCKVNKLFYIGHIMWQTYLVFLIGEVYFGIENFIFSQELNSI